MNTHFAKEDAIEIVKNLYARNEGLEGQGTIPTLQSINVDDIVVNKVQYPPSFRVMWKNGDQTEEIVMKVYGVLCGASLPPLKEKPKRLNTATIRGLRQHVRITGLGLEEFGVGVKNLERIHEVIGKAIRGKGLQDMQFVPYEGHAALDSHARYFTDRSHAPHETNQAFPSVIDPYNVLADIRPDYFIYGEDNRVEYCKEAGDGTHEPYDPSLFKSGDIVEVAFSCVCVEVKNRQHRIILNLRAMTLIEDKVRKDAEGACKAKRREPTQKVTAHSTRKRLYVDMGTYAERNATRSGEREAKIHGVRDDDNGRDEAREEGRGSPTGASEERTLMSKYGQAKASEDRSLMYQDDSNRATGDAQSDYVPQQEGQEEPQARGGCIR
ncbi:hypothetical protein EST38_g14397 [Candolleomyces aberdarensis]|uniref:Uncharacterized protein n=1 Tax=Candolleomyces aberdarensis TaxID=2316362 RepID=A0A4V1Q1G0_9AGAR|nr:hypothetical protein EST38_g14397 [Candolleomyces aberdarensis]